MLYSTTYISPLGTLFLESDGTHLIGLRNNYWRQHSKTPLPSFPDGSTLTCMQQAKNWLDIYFSGQKPDFIPPLSLCGSDFQKQVWQLLLDIPYGTLTTYGEIAKKITQIRHLKSMSAQAVGGAVGANPIAIIIPCHRVIGKNNNLVGFGGGLKFKSKLLELENISTQSLIMPKNSRFLETSADAFD